MRHEYPKREIHVISSKHVIEAEKGKRVFLVLFLKQNVVIKGHEMIYP